jgi:hypothetical protein
LKSLDIPYMMAIINVLGGRIAQRESIGLTSRGSQVQILFRLPEMAFGNWLTAYGEIKGFPGDVVQLG